MLVVVNQDRRMSIISGFIVERKEFNDGCEMPSVLNPPNDVVSIDSRDCCTGKSVKDSSSRQALSP